MKRGTCSSLIQLADPKHSVFSSSKIFRLGYQYSNTWNGDHPTNSWYGVRSRAHLADCVRVHDLRTGTLDVVAPGLRILATCYIKTIWRLSKKFPDQRPLSNELLSAAVRLAYIFAMVGGEHIAQAFLGSEFCIKWCCSDDHSLEVEYDRQRDGNLLETFKNFARKFQEYECSDHAVHRSL